MRRSSTRIRRIPPSAWSSLVDNSPLPDESVTDVIDTERRVRWLQQALEVLNERELRILRARRLDDEQVTLEFLGDRLGISKERVRQIENGPWKSSSGRWSSAIPRPPAPSSETRIS